MAKPFASDLLAWFHAAKRVMPWRESKDPYRIWLSEVMLQQTQVATVIPYFDRFVALFPTPQALAEAPTEQVLKAWEGLGYYSRARNLQAAARVVVAAHGGAMPTSYEGLRALPGIGDYTAGAVASIAYGLAVPAVDGNVLRVIARVMRLEADVSKPATKKAVEAILSELQPPHAPGDFNEALMELGATVCVPKSPRCEQCPVAGHCRAFAAGVERQLPVKAAKKAPIAVTLAAALIEHEGRVLLLKRPETGIWAGLWALPSAEVADAEGLARALADAGLTVEVGPLWTTLTHTLTHRQLTIPVYRSRLLAGEPAGPSAWVDPNDHPYALPVPFQKALASLTLGPLFS